MGESGIPPGRTGIETFFKSEHPPKTLESGIPPGRTGIET